MCIGVYCQSFLGNIERNDGVDKKDQFVDALLPQDLVDSSLICPLASNTGDPRFRSSGAAEW